MNDRELQQEFHEQLLNILNTRLGEPLKFYTPLITALTGVGWVFLQFSLTEDAPSLNDQRAILHIAYLISMLLVGGAIGYLYTICYTYRVFQVVICDLEKALGLDYFRPQWCERIRNRDSRELFWIVPEHLKSHLYILILTGLIITTAYLVSFPVPCYSCNGLLLTCPSIIIAACIIVIITFFHIIRIRFINDENHIILNGQTIAQSGSGYSRFMIVGIVILAIMGFGVVYSGLLLLHVLIASISLMVLAEVTLGLKFKYQEKLDEGWNKRDEKQKDIRWNKLIP